MNETPTPRTDDFLSRNSSYMEKRAYMMELERELTEVTKQRDALAEAIITHRAKAFPLTGEDFDQELWQVLQSLTPNEL